MKQHTWEMSSSALRVEDLRSLDEIYDHSLA